MGGVGLLIVFAIFGSMLCAKARVSGGAVVFAVVAVVLFVGTPAGAGVPGAIVDFLSTIGEAAEPLTGESAPDG